MLDAEFERLIRAARQAPARERDRALAAAGECPTAEDVRRLHDGRLLEADRRNALARHLSSCPRCADANLATLLATEVPATRTITPVRPMRRVAGMARWAAAAVLLIAALVGVESGARGTAALGGAWLVDPFGQELRDALAEPVARRVLVRASSDGWLVLVRRGAETVRVEAIDGPARITRVHGGEEVVLPLTGALEVPAPEDWIVLHLRSPIDDEQLDALARRAVRGDRPAGVDVLRFPVSPTRPE